MNVPQSRLALMVSAKTHAEFPMGPVERMPNVKQSLTDQFVNAHLLGLEIHTLNVSHVSPYFHMFEIYMFDCHIHF